MGEAGVYLRWHSAVTHSDRELCSAWAQSAELGGWGLSCFCLPWLKPQLSSDPPRGPVVVVLCFTATKGLGQTNFIFTLSVFSKKKDGLCGFIHCGKLCFPSCSVVARASLSQALKPGAERVTPCSLYSRCRTARRGWVRLL